MPDSIDAVIEELDAIVKNSIEQASPLGYFAALYKRVTIQVRDAIKENRFEDNERMEKLDIIFANRYLEAYRSFQEDKVPTQSWQVAFKQADSNKLIVLQHLLLGMSAHINLDLGIAAAQATRENPLASKSDFMSINKILSDLINDTQTRLTRIFRPLGLIDRLLGPIDEKLSLFSIGYARDKAWTQTLELSLSNGSEQLKLIAERDQAVANFSSSLVRPPKISLRILLRLIRLLERGRVSDRIKTLDT
ncbi:DUF5995 family protein [Pelagicoccus mobilis]|uniref:Uncharacterized protein n=1 Tax=Pelagicoccus mobilis TaxID=415221 RepID=A0A934RZC1_9BACT|nr:DUF5995 family protein [Pelagicoccus mobilis]MBK1878084.1 hypothetical protein [Pelagicoccus mobilis]